jgi:membrane protein DedA with SNARE-associated domain
VPYLAGPPPMPGFLNALSGPLNHYGYLAVFALVMLEDFGIPVPGETILIAAAIYAGHQQLNIVAVGLIGFIAAVIGDNIGFAIGHFGGRAVALRWGKYVFLTEERLDKAEYFFNRHGGKIIVVARFIEGLRQANGIIAGISGMRWLRFLFFNALGAALWVGTWVSVGYLAGNHIETIYHYITRYSLYALIAVAVLLAALIIRYVLRRRRRAAQRGDREPEDDLGRSDDPEVHDASEPREDGGTHEDERTRDHAETPDGVAAPGSTGPQDSAEPPDSAGPQDSAEIPPNAKTQSS